MPLLGDAVRLFVDETIPPPTCRYSYADQASHRAKVKSPVSLEVETGIRVVNEYIFVF